MTQQRDVPESEQTYHARIDPHLRGTSLSELILGGQDGLVSILGLLLGLAAATSSTKIIVVED